MSLYLIILIISVAVPLLLSFDRKVGFYKLWRYIFPAMIISSAAFIVIDIIFTRSGIWGFNPQYHSGILIAGLPLEEWLFFILIPYSCLFIHYVYKYYSGNYSLSDSTVKWISIALILIMLIITIVNSDKTYTVVYSVFTAAVILLAFADKSKILNSYLVSFLIMLVPFFIVNAILTGTFIEDEVVWYNNEEIIGIRVLTIPVEDFWYSFSMIAMSLIITEKLRMRGIKS